MLTGREALTRIEDAIETARSEASGVRAQLTAINERELSLRGGVREALEELARIRLETSQADDLSRRTADLGRRVDDLMARRAEEQNELELREKAIAGRLVALDDKRAETAKTVESVSEQLDAAEAALQDALSKRADHKEQVARVEAAEAIAHEAENKHTLAEEDRKTKGAPYEADPLFTYLWKRGFGTAAYRGSGIIRMADRWVARLCRYQDARPNYHMLLEIPKRLGEHSAAMRTAADAQIDALVALEEEARDKTEVPDLEATLKIARGAIEAVDAEIATLRTEGRESAEKRARFERGEDTLYVQAVDAIADLLGDRSVTQLRRAASRTPMPEDDAIVSRMIELEESIDDLDHERADIRAMARRSEDRLDELEDLRVDFRRKRYDDYSSEFDDDSLFGVVLAEFLRGAITGVAYRDRLDRHHRRRARRSKPDFGSGKFRFPGPLSFPGSRGSSGGFRTGGRMSGGGFRSGGGF